MSETNYVKSQLVYWAQVNAAAVGGLVDYAAQQGPGLLTGAMAASVYNITMPANFTIPANRRLVVLTPTLAALGATVQYDLAASIAGGPPAPTNLIVVRGSAFGGGALDVSFQIAIYRIEIMN